MATVGGVITPGITSGPGRDCDQAERLRDVMGQPAARCNRMGSRVTGWRWDAP